MSIEDYDVFLSFRGEVRNTFSCYLYEELKRHGYKPFIDRENITNGDDINEMIKRGIKYSKSAIVIFSQKYASSKHCLNELLLILDRNRTSNYFIIPIFYYVEVADVKYQSHEFGDAFDHVKKRNTDEKVEAWRAALAEAGQILGEEIKGHDQRMENKIITDIVTSFKQKFSEHYEKVLIPESKASEEAVVETNTNGKVVFGSKLKKWMTTNPKFVSVTVLVLIIFIIAGAVVSTQIYIKSSKSDRVKLVTGNGDLNSNSSINSDSGINWNPSRNSGYGRNYGRKLNYSRDSNHSIINPNINTIYSVNLSSDINSNSGSNWSSIGRATNLNETTTSGYSNEKYPEATTKNDTGLTTNPDTKIHF